MIRTRRLAIGADVGTILAGAGEPREAFDQVIYTVPDGHRAIVRDCRFAASLADPQGPGSLELYVNYAVGNDWATIDAATFTDPFRSYALVCDVVLEAGDRLGLYFTIPVMRWIITGAELTI